MAASSVYSNEEAAQQPDELYYSTARAATLLVLLLLAAHAAAYAKLRLSVGADRDTDDVVPMLLGTLALGYSWSHAALILLAFAAVSHAPAILCSVLLQRAADACRYLLVPFAYLYHEAVGVGYAWGPSRAIGRAAEASALMALIALLVKGTLDVLGLLLPAAAPNGMSAPRALQALFSAASVLLALLSATRGAMHPLLTWITEERPSPSSAATATGSGAGALAAAEASLLLQPIVEDGWAVRMLQQMRGVREERGLLGAARAAARATLHLAGGALWALLSMRVLLAQLRMLASGGAAGAQGGQGDLPGSWIGHCLAAYFVAAAVLGHHLLCRYQLTNMGTSRRPRGTPLQMQLLEVATLQALTPAIPGAAHALGLVANGLKKRTLVEGTLRVLFSRRRGFVELGAEPGGFVDKSLAVKTDDLAAAASAPDRNSVNLNGFAALNRALHGDRVAVCLDTDESAEGSGDRVAMGLDTDESAEGSGTDYAAKDDGSILGAIYQSWAGLLNRKAPPVQAVEPVLAESFAGRDGRVVAVLQRNPRKLVAAVEARPAHLDDASPLLVTPRDERFPKMRLAGADASYDDLLGKLVVVEIVDWVEDEEYAEARHVSTLGTAGDGAVEAQAILIEHDVRVEPFSTAVEACLPREDYTISDAEIAKRLDLRHGPALISSIDPPGCKDIDDAIHARALGDGKYEVGVHISDVCSFIEAGSALDREAAARAETFYLINARANMVPPLLSENLASLHPNVDRLAFSVIWHMDEEANISSTQFVKTVIRSKAALSYDEAQRRIDDESFDDELSQSLRVLMRITRARKEQRRLNDALELDSQEVAFRFDGDGSEASKAEDGVMQLPTGMRRLSDGEPSETHSLIEELMVLANVSVAEEIVRTFPSKSLLRHHPRPNLEQFDDIRAALERRNLPFDARDNAALSRTLRATRDPKEESFGSVVRALCTRRMKMAQYFRTGSMAPEKWMHSGLGEPLYTHFTSPIRRYCDQVVHRQLAHAIGWRALPAEGWYTDNLDDLSESLNERHKMAQEAERKSEALYLTLYFRDRKVVEDAYVTKLGDAGVGLMLPEYGIEGYTPLVSAGYENPWTLDSKKGELQAGSNLKLRVLDKVRVRVGTELGPALKPRLVLTIVHPPLPQGRKLPPSRLGRASETFEGFEWGWRRGHGGKEELLIGPDKRKRKLDKRVQSTKRKAKPARTSSAA